MDESVRRLRANKVIAGSRCGWCDEEVNLGDEIAVCRECDLVHHGSCWDRQAGCGTDQCVNAPLERMPSPETGARRREGPGKVACPNCGRLSSPNVSFCPYCKSRIGRRSPRSSRRGGGRYSERARAAKAERGLSGLDWVLCILCSTIGCIVGIVALVQGEKKRGGIMIAVSIGASIFWTLVRFAVDPRLR